MAINRINEERILASFRPVGPTARSENQALISLLQRGSVCRLITNSTPWHSIYAFISKQTDIPYPLAFNTGDLVYDEPIFY